MTAPRLALLAALLVLPGCQQMFTNLWSGSCNTGLPARTPTPDTQAVIEDSDVESVRIVDDSGALLGRLTWPDGELHFEGDADASARAFFVDALKPIVDSYIAAKVGRRSERPLPPQERQH